MKILLVGTVAVEHDFSISTYNTQSVGLATELTKLGHECGLVFYSKKGKGFTETINSDGCSIKVYHIEGKNLINNAIYNNELYKICEQYDVIQTSECDQIATWQIYKRFPNKTIIYHGPYKSKYTKKYNLRSKVFDLIFLHRKNYTDVPVITKSYLAEDYLRKKGFKNVCTLGVGLNDHNLEQVVDDIPDKIKKQIETKEDNKYILYIGEISKRKNFLFVLKILDEIVNKKHLKEYKLIVIGGKAHHGEKYYNKCFRYIENHKLKENVIYLGKVEQKYLKYIYKCSDVYVLPTQYDIFGMVFLEAMYYGVPIITTFCGGSSLLIKNENDGFIRELNDTKEWSDTIIKINENQEIKNQISINTQNKIKSNYLWSKLVVKFEQEYNKIKK